MRATLCLFLGLVAWGAWATSATSLDSAPDQLDQLDRVASELDEIASDLATAQAQAEELRDRLAGLEALTTEHQAALKAQAELQARYYQAVADLEAHDRASLALAEDLKRQLDAERTLVAWALPAGAVVLGVAVVEGWLLVRR